MAPKPKLTKQPAPTGAIPPPEPLLAVPQSKSVAAQQARITLRTDDSWSTPYWTKGDLHCRERELLG